MASATSISAAVEWLSVACVVVSPDCCCYEMCSGGWISAGCGHESDTSWWKGVRVYKRVEQGLWKYSDKLLVLMRATPVYFYGSQPKYTTRQSSNNCTIKYNSLFFFFLLCLGKEYSKGRQWRFKDPAGTGTQNNWVSHNPEKKPCSWQSTTQRLLLADERKISHGMEESKTEGGALIKLLTKWTGERIWRILSRNVLFTTFPF